MNARQLKSQLSQALLEKSGLDHHRAYLGMSQIGHCPRQLYHMMLEGLSGDDLDAKRHWFCWTGYMHESALLDLLDANPAQRGIEVVADFDPRFRGHVDFVLDGNGIVEIKSTNWHKFQRIIKQNVPDRLHTKQVQSYLHHGGWDRAFIIYLARDVPFQEWRGLPIWIFELSYSKALAQALDIKARRVLDAVDTEMPPECECHFCGD